MIASTDGKCDRPPRGEPIPCHDDQDGDDANAEHNRVNPAELAEQQIHTLEEIMATAGNAEQTGQLGHGDGQAGAGLEADENAVADQFDQNASLKAQEISASPATVKAARLAI